MASRYRVQYRIIPAGVGPDDYESCDLESGETVVELSDQEPAFFVGNVLYSYQPPRPEVVRAVSEHLRLPDGAEPIIRTVERVVDEA